MRTGLSCAAFDGAVVLEPCDDLARDGGALAASLRYLRAALQQSAAIYCNFLRNPI